MHLLVAQRPAIVALVVCALAFPGTVWAFGPATGPAPNQKPPTIAELIARLDDNVAAALKEDQQLSRLQETIPQQMKALRADQLVIVSKEEQLKAAQERLAARIKAADDELAKVHERIRNHDIGVEAWNNRCAEDRVGKLSQQAYEKCQQEKAILMANAADIATVRDRWQAEKDTLQAQFDKNEAMFKSLTAEWFTRDAKLRDLAKRLQAAAQRRAAIADNIKRLKQLRAKMVAAKCPAAKTGTAEELKLKCGNVQFDRADPNLPALEEICPKCVMPPDNGLRTRSEEFV